MVKAHQNTELSKVNMYHILNIDKNRFGFLHWLSTKEFLALFSCRKNCSDRWDFFRLIILLSLTMTLALFAIGTKEGLLDNFTEVLLGRVPEQGIPIWMQSNIGFSKIDGKALANYPDFYPYDKVKAKRLRLPGCSELENTGENFSSACDLWKDQKAGANNAPPFTGIAVFSDDPLWKFSNSKEKQYPNSLSIVLSYYQFKKKNFFNFNAYLKQMRKRLPKKYADELPTKEEFFSKDYSGKIWLSIGVDSDSRLLTPMKVTWVDRIPVPGKYSFFISMDLYESLRLINSYPDLISHYYPESSKFPYISELKINSDTMSNEIISTLTDCLQNPNNPVGDKNINNINFEDSGNAIFKLKPPKTKKWVKNCLQDVGIIKTCEKGKPPGYTYKDTCYQVTSANEGMLSSMVFSRNKNGGYSIKIKDGKPERLKKLFADKLRDQFKYGFTYVSNSAEISSIVNNIENIEKSPFHFNKTYKDSLNRFETLRDTLNMLSKSYGKIVTMFVVSLLFIQFLIVVGHRKHNYYIYTTKGFKYSDIMIMLCLQAVWTSLIAIVLSYAILYSFSSLISNAAVTLFKEHEDILINSSLDLLKLDIIDYIKVVLLSSIASIAICILLVMMMDENSKIMSFWFKVQSIYNLGKSN